MISQTGHIYITPSHVHSQGNAEECAKLHRFALCKQLGLAVDMYHMDILVLIIKVITLLKPEHTLKCKYIALLRGLDSLECTCRKYI